MTAPAWRTGDILLAVWLAGAGVALIYIALSYIMPRQRMRRGAMSVPQHVRRIFEAYKRTKDIHRDVKLRGIRGIGTPALMTSTIIVPDGLMRSMSDTQIEYAFRHELTHYKRGDQIVSFILLLLQAAYWFNPFVWLAFRQTRADIKVACDSAVVKKPL